MERLFEAGALDVWHTPIQMKKNRPGVLLSALGPAALESRLAEVFLRDTPTLGVRVRPVGRYVADRDIVTVETEYGPMRREAEVAREAKWSARRRSTRTWRQRRGMTGAGWSAVAERY